MKKTLNSKGSYESQMKFRRGKKKKKRSFEQQKPQRDGKRKGPWLCCLLQKKKKKKKKKKNQTCLFQSILWLQMALRVAVIKQTEKGHGRE